MSQGANFTSISKSDYPTSLTDHPSRSMTCVCFAKPSSLGVAEPFLSQKQPYSEPFWAVPHAKTAFFWAEPCQGAILVQSCWLYLLDEYAAWPDRAYSSIQVSRLLSCILFKKCRFEDVCVHTYCIRIKTGLFGQPDPKVLIWQAWRIEFSYKDVRNYWERLQGWVRGAVRMWVCACFVRTIKNAGSI